MEVALSIVGIATTAFQVMGYLKDVKDANESRILILEEVTSLWRIYLRLQHYVETTSEKQEDDPVLHPLRDLDGPEGIIAQADKQLKQLAQQLAQQLAPVQTQRSFGRIVSSMKWPFEEKEAQRILDRLQALKSSTTLVLQQSSHQGLRVVLEGIDYLKSTLDNESFRKLLLWLSPTNFGSKQKDILGQVDPLMCRILESGSFSSWQKADLRSLWIHGDHGAGKSVASASIYEVLSKQHRTDNVFVIGSFCSHDDEQSQSPRSVFASLLKQVLQARGQNQVPRELKEYYSKADEQSIDLKTLSEILRDEILSRDGAYVILDGLDEVGNDEDRVAMVKATHDIGATVKIIITSRPSTDIPKAIQATQSCTQCGLDHSEVYWRCTNCHSHVVCERCFQKETGKCDAVSTPQKEKKHQNKRELRWQGLKYQPQEIDIRDYVEGRLGPDTTLGRLVDNGPTSLRQETIDTVTANSGDIFMLARTHLDLLDNCPRPADVKKTLKILNPSLPEMFKKTLDRIEKNMHPNHHRIFMKLLLWVSWTQRPLSVYALGHALAVLPDSESIDKDEVYPIQDYVDRSIGLLQVDRQELVRFAHETTKRFFVDHRDNLQDLCLGHGKIAHACLDYLNMKVLQEPLSGPDQRSLFFNRLAEYPLMEYAVLHSFKHVNLSPEKRDDSRAVEFLLSNARRSLVQALYYLDRNWNIETDVSPQHLTVYLGLTEVFSDLLEEAEDIDVPDEFGATALMYAAGRGDTGLPDMQLLLQAGANPTITCNIGSTALIRAVSLDATEIVRRLVLEPDISINAVPLDAASFSGPALIIAARSSNVAILKLLMARDDIDMNQTDNGKPDGRTSLHIAAMRGDAEVLRLLLAHERVNIESQGTSRRSTAIFQAASSGKKECLEILLDRGADINSLDSCAGNALMRAADADHQHVAKLLVDRGINVKQRDFLGRTALHSAATNHSRATLEYLLHDVPGIEVNRQDDAGETALHDACYYDDTHSVRILVSAGARCDLKNQKGQTPVDMATAKKGFYTLEALQDSPGFRSTIEARVDVKKSLLEAIMTDPVEVLRARLETVTIDDPELNTSLPFEGTPLIQACKRGEAEIVKLLLVAGADVELTNTFTGTPLSRAIASGQLNCVKVLLDHGANVERSTSNDMGHMTLWQYAWSLNFPDIAFLLIEHGAVVEEGSRYIQEALQEASDADNVVVARRLVEAGASIHHKIDGENALQIAEYSGAREVLEYFASLDG